MKPYTRNAVREISEKHGFRRADSLGQNFLVDRNIIEKIIDAAELTENTLVIEIGPGMGALTQVAAEKAGKVIAVEIDRHLIPVLGEVVGHLDNVEIINQDILKTDINELIDSEKKNFATSDHEIDKVVILGNLPYYITTPIIMGILERQIEMDTMVIMMQKEVAERIVATPGGKTYGALSIACQFFCETNYVTTVPRTVFQPQPKVDSAVLRLDKRAELPWEIGAGGWKLFFEVVRAGFNRRRKTLLNALTALGMDKTELRSILDEAGIEPSRRAETLSIQEFANVANAIGIQRGL
ncbi:MAG: 16S rRNA (adenine(1518)-N(6)/adenine(1519)-N(6))-dimethyltransferase RsmA [Christensenellales bacterium]